MDLCTVPTEAYRPNRRFPVIKVASVWRGRHHQKPLGQAKICAMCHEGLCEKVRTNRWHGALLNDQRSRAPSFGVMRRVPASSDPTLGCGVSKGLHGP